MSKASKIKALLEREIAEKGISVREIARKTTVSNQTLYGILNGKIEKPQNKTVTKLAVYFGLTRDEIIGKTAPGLSEAPPDLDSVGKAIRFYGSGGETLRELIKMLTGGPSEDRIESGTYRETLSPIIDFFSSKYVEGDHLVIPIKEIYATYPDIGEKIIGLLLKFEMGELYERLSREYEIREKNPNGDIESEE